MSPSPWSRRLGGVDGPMINSPAPATGPEVADGVRAESPPAHLPPEYLLVDARHLVRQMRDAIAAVPGHEAEAATLTEQSRAMTAILARSPWVHSLGRTVSCEGCEHDGWREPCQTPIPGDDRDEEDGHPHCDECGHMVALGEEDRWRCAGEDSEHWPGQVDEGDSPLFAACGHCGWEPDWQEIAEMVEAGRATPAQAEVHFELVRGDWDAWLAGRRRMEELAR